MDGDHVALHTQSVIQGAFILAKAKGSAAVAAESLDHLRRYLALLFAKPGGGRIASGAPRGAVSPRS
jgi:TetR/AcrR family transcriptional repressor of nem operon